MISVFSSCLALLSWGSSSRETLSPPVWSALLLVGGMIAGCTTTPAAQSPRISISPPDPQLGYTLSVLVEFDTQVEEDLKVTFQDWVYPALPIGPQQWRALLPSSPLDTPGEKQIHVQGLEIDQTFTVTLADRSFPTQRVQLPPSIANLEATEIELERVNGFRAQITSTKHWQGFFRPPSQGGVTTIYGVRRYYNGVFAEDYYHRGIDYASPYGGAITAPAAGQVGLVGLESEGFLIHGNTVGLDHGHGVTSVFLHMSRIDVQEGDWVEAGQVIGGVGASGLVTGPHLHWGLFVNGISVDPVPWMFLDVR